MSTYGHFSFAPLPLKNKLLPWGARDKFDSPHLELFNVHQNVAHLEFLYFTPIKNTASTTKV